MRADFIKAELSRQAFAVHPKILDSVVSTLNEGVPKAESVEKHAHNSVEYETIKNVAVISIDGGMYKRDMSAYCMDVASYESIIIAINEAEADSQVDTIFFRVDTPGGSVAGVDEVGDRIFNSPKKTITLFENMGASGGIWAFTASDEVYATESTMLGSIGVVVTYLKDDDSEDNTVTIVSKNADNKRCNLKGDCEEKIKSMINGYEDIFYARVQRNTGFSSEKIKTVFNNGGMIFSKDAKESGFIQGIATFNDLIEISIGNMVASMPTDTVIVADKIEKKSNIRGDDMPKAITQADLDAVQAKFDTATATISTHEALIDSIKLDADAKLAKAESTITELKEDAKTQSSVSREIVAMGYEHGATKSVALNMLSKGSLSEAGLVILQSKKSNGHTPTSDLAEDSDNGDALVAYAQEHKGSIR